MTQWKDAYIADENEMKSVKPPVAFSVTSGGLQIWVARGHRSSPNQWVYTCRALGIYAMPIGIEDTAPSKEAQARAHALVGGVMTELRTDFQKILEE
jgi:hypothetical protein